MSLFPQSTAKKMSSSAGFHADQHDLQVRGEAQQLVARALLANHNFATRVEPNQVKHCLP